MLEKKLSIIINPKDKIVDNPNITIRLKVNFISFHDLTTNIPTASGISKSQIYLNFSSMSCDAKSIWSSRNNKERVSQRTIMNQTVIFAVYGFIFIKLLLPFVFYFLAK